MPSPPCYDPSHQYAPRRDFAPCAPPHARPWPPPRGAPPPRPPAPRPPLARIAFIDRAVRAGELPNAHPLARALEVDHRTVQRALAFMRDRLAAPLAYDACRHGYAYADPG